MGIRRIPPRHRPSYGSQEPTQALSDFIVAWKQGDPVAVAELMPWLEAEVGRQLARLIPESGASAPRIDASDIIDATLLQVATGADGPLEHRAHLMAVVAP